MFCSECGKQLPDQAKFCLFCGAEVKEWISQDSKQKEEIHLQKTETNNLLQEILEKGYQALENMQFEKAGGYFGQAVSMDFECAEAYWGYVLLSNQCRNMAEFISKWTDDIEDIQKEVFEAVSYGEDVQKAVEKYEIKGFLYEEKIRQIFSYGKDICYYSDVRYREERLKGTKEYFEYPKDRNLKEMYRFMNGEFSRKISKMQDTIYSILEEKLAQVKEKDQQQITYITKEYHEFLEHTEQIIKREYEEACAQQEACYKKACDCMSEGNYEIARTYFVKLEEYKDSISRLAECNRIKELEKVQISNTYQSYSSRVDTGGSGWWVLGCFFPIIGGILWLVWKDEKPRTASAVIKGAIFSVILCIGIYVLFFLLLGFAIEANAFL